MEMSLRTRTALEIAQWALAETISARIRAPRILAVATIRGWCFFSLGAPDCVLLFKGENYLREAFNWTNTATTINNGCRTYYASTASYFIGHGSTICKVKHAGDWTVNILPASEAHGMTACNTVNGKRHCELVFDTVLLNASWMRSD